MVSFEVDRVEVIKIDSFTRKSYASVLENFDQPQPGFTDTAEGFFYITTDGYVDGPRVASFSEGTQVGMRVLSSTATDPTVVKLDVTLPGTECENGSCFVGILDLPAISFGPEGEEEGGGLIHDFLTPYSANSDLSDAVIRFVVRDMAGGRNTYVSILLMDIMGNEVLAELYPLSTSSSEANGFKAIGGPVTVNEGSIVAVPAVDVNELDQGTSFDLTNVVGIGFDFWVDDGPLVINIDIKPGSFPNSINLSSSGVVPVAILGTATFDVTTVDPDTIALAGAGVMMVGKSSKYLCSLDDINVDTYIDLICNVYTANFIIELGESAVILDAKTFDGQSLRGEDIVRIVPD